MDGRAALGQILNMLETEYFDPKGASMVAQNSQELVGKTDPAIMCVETDSAWRRYKCIVPHSMLAAFTVA